MLARTLRSQQQGEPSPRLQRLLHLAAPRGSFLREWLEYCHGLETAWLFDLFSGLWLLSSTLGHRCSVARGVDRLRLNLFVLLVAPSGVARKSTSVGLAHRAWETARPLGALTISHRHSPEEINAKLRTNPHCAFVASELVSVLGRTGHTYLLPSLLSDLYDCPHVKGQPGDPELSLPTAYSTLLAASTEDWLGRSLRRDDITGGFGSRILPVIATRAKRIIPWPEEREDEQAFLGRQAGRLRGEPSTLTLTPAARQRYISWYRGEQDGEPLSSRAPDHVLKLAGLLALGRGDKEVGRVDIDAAISLVDVSSRARLTLFSHQVDQQRPRSDVLTARVSDLQQVLEAQGTAWISQSDLTRRFAHRLNARGLRNILDVMHDLRMVQRAESTGDGRTTTLWRGTTLLHEIPIETVLSEVDKSR